MTITVILNGAKRTDEVQADTTLFDYLRSHGCLSVRLRDRQLSPPASAKRML